MFQPTRRVLAAAGLVVFLGLGISVPSRAAGLPGLPGGAPAIASRVWTWLEGLLAGVASPRPSERPARPGKTTSTTTTPTTPTSEPKPTTEQGNMIDPNGIR
jgi:hypothetical protein